MKQLVLLLMIALSTNLNSFSQRIESGNYLILTFQIENYNEVRPTLINTHLMQEKDVQASIIINNDETCRVICKKSILPENLIKIASSYNYKLVLIKEEEYSDNRFLELYCLNNIYGKNDEKPEGFPKYYKTGVEQKDDLNYSIIKNLWISKNKDKYNAFIKK